MKLTLNIFGINKDYVKKIPWALGSHAFSVILFLILLGIVLGMFLFYKYEILVEIKEQETTGETVKFNYTAYQAILKKWQLKEEAFKASEGKIYSNPFTVAPENFKK